VFLSCSSLTSICIPNSVQQLDSDCFRACESLREVHFEAASKLRRIESRVFSGCSLSSIHIPGSVEFICSECFFACESLREVVFEAPSRISSIQPDSFARCRSLTSIRVPESHRPIFEPLVRRVTLDAELVQELDSILGEMKAWTPPAQLICQNDEPAARRNIP
jgi:hypothetical protein